MKTIDNQVLEQIKDYPFEQLEAILPKIHQNEDIYKMYIGEPITNPPSFIGEIIKRYQNEFSKYPTVAGLLPLREAIFNYLNRRFNLKDIKLDINSQILPTVGSKEAIYGIGTLLSVYTSSNKTKYINLLPNPFYQVYKSTSLLNGAQTYYLNATKENNFQPDISELPENILNSTKLAIICNPSNPQGAIMDTNKIISAIATARKYNFIILFDECYTDLYNNEIATGAIDAIKKMDGSFDNIVISHTLSKRSSAAGLRSGFIAGDKQILADFKKLRSYMSPVLPEPIMHASIALWNDEEHVKQTRKYYADNFKIADEVFKDYPNYQKTDGAIYLWLPVTDETKATIKIWQELKAKVLPGRFLGNTDEKGFNPGSNYIRITLNYEANIYKKILPGIKECLESI